MIPVRDDAAFLDRCLEALSAQTYLPDEVIVVDNGSTDATADVARRHGARIISVQHPGVGRASAAGYDAAKSVIIARLDSDSEPGADWVAVIQHAFSRHADLTAVTGGAVFSDGPRHLRRIAARLYLCAYFITVTGALGHPPVFGSNCAFTRESWLAVRDDVHRYDDDAHDDIDLSYHLGPEARIRYDPRLTLRISSRPFSGQFRRRLQRGVHSIVLHWPDDLPWRRFARRTWWQLTRAGRRR